jgi:hypothetical protein
MPHPPRLPFPLILSSDRARRGRVSKGLALFLTLPLTLTAALAADPPAPAAADAQRDTRQICRGGQKTVSSRIRTTRRCRSAEAWREEDEKSARLPIGAQVTQGQNDGRAPAQPR